MGQKKVTVRLDGELYREVLQIMEVHFPGIKKQNYFNIMLESWVRRFRR